ncbi:MAG TPA: enoyl-CoA hydratase/isomerase family protein [Hyphomicrobiaceae bacterium]|nr:enoyl-CoA hydratase/isomerase family protein [Hyphomicrobiaceae bacterium]
MADAANGLAIGPGVAVATTGALGRITLNRPKALHALNDAMRAEISAAIPGFSRDPNIYAVAIEASDARAFCAGGDIRELSALALQDLEAARASLAGEYRMNWQLDCFTKPVVSLMDGLCMGSGVGLTMYNTHRVAGERYAFAMPETGVGLFPDLGVCWVLARLPDEIGTFLGLTGHRIGAADALQLGLITHCIPRQQFPAIIDALADAQPIDPLLDERHQPFDAATFAKDAKPVERLMQHKALISDVFSANSMEEIMQRLAQQAAGAGLAASFCETVRADLLRRSPTSLKITLRHLREAAKLDLRQTLEHDHRIASWCLAARDFHEGVRAILLEKDNLPAWDPAELINVCDHELSIYFSAYGEADLKLPERSAVQDVSK